VTILPEQPFYLLESFPVLPLVVTILPELPVYLLESFPIFSSRMESICHNVLERTQGLTISIWGLRKILQRSVLKIWVLMQLLVHQGLKELRSKTDVLAPQDACDQVLVFVPGTYLKTYQEDVTCNLKALEG
jgi:hypothetical protein